MAIARIWNGATRAEDADRYVEYLRKTGLAAFATTPGNLAAYCLRRIDGDEAEFTIISLWRDLTAVEAFAGSKPEVAVFYPEDGDFLVRRDEFVSHHEVVFYGEPAAGGRQGRLGRILGWWARTATAALPAPRAIAKGPPRGMGGASADRVRRDSGSVAA